MAQVAAALANVPTGVNPYLYFAAILDNFVGPGREQPGLAARLFFLMGLMA